MYNTQYEQAMTNVANDQPDFHFDLGDTFMTDGLTGLTLQADVNDAYLAQRNPLYMDRVGHSSPIFLASGNHENEEGWNLDDTYSIAQASIQARKMYFPTPVTDGFYSGNEDPLAAIEEATYGDELREDYYAWEWGDALFIVFDPFQYTMANPYGSFAGEGSDDPASGDRWNWTLGHDQYYWLKETLEGSTAKYKFMFAHHMLGGTQDYVRGGAVPAHMFEWGGYESNGTTWGFTDKRTNVPAYGFADPIRQLMIDNGVTAFFHGHDHQYAYEVRDGIVYLSMPRPSTGLDFNYYNESNEYTERVMTSPGHLRVTVTPTQATAEYVSSSSSAATVNHQFVMQPNTPVDTHDLTVSVSPSGSGTTNPSAGVHAVAENSNVTVTATAASGYQFDHWSGACSGSGSCVVTMDGDKSVTANFVTDDSDPTVTINQAPSQADPTHSSTINFRAVFSEPVTGFATGDVTISGTAGATTAAVSEISPNDGTTYNVAVSGMTGPGTVIATIAAGVAVDGIGNSNEASTSTDNMVTYEETPSGYGYIGDIGSATIKSTASSIDIVTTADVAAGDAIIIAYATDPAQNLVVEVTDSAGNDYEQAALAVNWANARSYIFAAYDVEPLPSGSTISITFVSADTDPPEARAAVVSVFRGLVEVDPLDQFLGNPLIDDQTTISGTTPTVGPTGTTAQADELLIGAVTTIGPVEDTAGIWDNSFTAGQRAGTTGGDIETNKTVSMGYRLVSEVGAYTAQKSGITDRGWAATIATFKMSESGPVERVTGDANRDGLVNSTDALVLLSYDVGLTTPYPIDECSDINGDTFVNSTDALIILSHDAGITVPYPVGGVCSLP
jgi:hypothetical protein